VVTAARVAGLLDLEPTADTAARRLVLAQWPATLFDMGIEAAAHARQLASDGGLGQSEAGAQRGEGVTGVSAVRVQVPERTG
jgi:hypothetical protein